MARVATFLLTLIALSAPWHAVQASTNCSSRTLSVRGTPVTVALCPLVTSRTRSGELVVSTSESLTANGKSMRTQRDFHFLSGEATSRAIELVDLSALGMTGTLHLTLAYHDASVTVESAVLTPGAIPVF